MRNWIGILVMAVLQSCTTSSDKIFPVRKTISESVYASVTVQPDSAYHIFAAVSGILEKVYVGEGSLVHQGTPLFKITDVTSNVQVQNASLDVALSAENYSGTSTILKDIEEEIQTTALVLSSDSLNYYRQKRLWDNRIGSQLELENKRLKYEQSQTMLKNLKNKYNRTQSELATRLRQSKNTYQSALAKYSDFTITSKLDGRIYAMYKNPGELINTLEPLGKIGKANAFIIEMLIDEVDIVKLAIDQKVIVSLDAYPGEVFTASVTKIYPQKDERSQTFLVEAQFTDPPKQLYAGLSGESNILIAIKENALIIPRSYVVEGKVRTNSGMVAVNTGLKSMDSIEILAGINESTQLLKPTQ